MKVNREKFEEERTALKKAEKGVKLTKRERDLLKDRETVIGGKVVGYDDPIDPKISSTIDILNEKGYKTYMSCQGHNEPTKFYPLYVDFRGNIPISKLPGKDWKIEVNKKSRYIPENTMIYYQPRETIGFKYDPKVEQVFLPKGRKELKKFAEKLPNRETKMQEKRKGKK